VMCFCWPAELWFLHQRAFKTGREGLSIWAFSVHTLFVQAFSFLCPVSFHVCVLYEQLWVGGCRSGIQEAADPDTSQRSEALYAKKMPIIKFKL